MSPLKKKIGWIEETEPTAPGADNGWAGWTHDNFIDQDKENVIAWVRARWDDCSENIKGRLNTDFPNWEAQVRARTYGGLLDGTLARVRENTAKIANDILCKIFHLKFGTSGEKYKFVIFYLSGVEAHADIEDIEDIEFLEAIPSGIEEVRREIQGELREINEEEDPRPRNILRGLENNLRSWRNWMRVLDNKERRIAQIIQIEQLIEKTSNPEDIRAALETAFPNFIKNMANVQNLRGPSTRGLTSEFEDLSQKVRRKTIALDLDFQLTNAWKALEKRRRAVLTREEKTAAIATKTALERYIAQRETDLDIGFVLVQGLGWDDPLPADPLIKRRLREYDNAKYGGEVSNENVLNNIIIELNNIYMTEAQIWIQDIIDNNRPGGDGAVNTGRNTDRLIFGHNPDGGDGAVLTGDLRIENFPNLTAINLKGRSDARKAGLTSVTIVNCPNLTKINVENNVLVAGGLDISSKWGRSSFVIFRCFG